MIQRFHGVLQSIIQKVKYGRNTRVIQLSSTKRVLHAYTRVYVRSCVTVKNAQKNAKELSITRVNAGQNGIGFVPIPG